MFGPDRTVLQPSEALRKKAVLVERGSFRPPTLVNIDMLECALAKFEANPAVAGRPVLPLTELTMRNLLAGGAEVDRRDFLARADLLSACGMTVLISDYFEYYRLAAYLALRTEYIGIVMGVPSLIELFDEKYYAQLPGGILESFGRLFKNDLKIYVYPLQRSDGEELQTVDNLEVASELRSLYDYLAGRGSFVPLDNYSRVLEHLQPGRTQANRRRRRGLGDDGPAGGSRAHQAEVILRILEEPRRPRPHETNERRTDRHRRCACCVVGTAARGGRMPRAASGSRHPLQDSHRRLV